MAFATLYPYPSLCSSAKHPILKLPKSPPFLTCCSTSSNPLTTDHQQQQDEDILRAVLSRADNNQPLPGVRTYENDLALLTLLGSVDFQQSLTAAASDGGEAADEHLSAGVDAMVVETVFPGGHGEHSTISTRLFLPAKKVKEKAKKLKATLTEDILSSTTSRNILAMTFRQVVVQQLWNFELLLLKPGTERNMDDLANPREVPPSFTLSSSDERVISVLAEVICLAALESTERHALQKSSEGASNRFLKWFQKPKQIVSKDSSVILYNLLEHEIAPNARSLLENFSAVRPKYQSMKMKPYSRWWTSSVYSKLEKLGGPGFSSWVSEYIPSYRLQIDADRLPNVEFEGWRKAAANRWEVLLTHSQMVGLADILDMYYEDMFTMPSKQLSCGAGTKYLNFSSYKSSGSFLKMMSVAFASAVFLVSISIVSQLYLPHSPSGRKQLQRNQLLQSSNVNMIHYQSLAAAEVQNFCVSIVKRVNSAFGVAEDVMIQANQRGPFAWAGELPLYLKNEVLDSSPMDVLSSSKVSEASDDDLKASVQDIASYQVVLSPDGNIVGFEPTSRVAVNHWAANPLAKELYHRQNLTPGLIEPGLKITRPREVVVLELLMSANPESYFALVRPVDTAESSQ